MELVSVFPLPPVPMWAVQIRLFGELARRPDGKIKKLLTAAEDLTNLRRENCVIAKRGEKQALALASGGQRINGD